MLIKQTEIAVSHQQIAGQKIFLLRQLIAFPSEHVFAKPWR